jgi:hypothetical protein
LLYPIVNPFPKKSAWYFYVSYSKLVKYATPGVKVQVTSDKVPILWALEEIRTLTEFLQYNLKRLPEPAGIVALNFAFGVLLLLYDLYVPYQLS